MTHIKDKPKANPSPKGTFVGNSTKGAHLMSPTKAVKTSTPPKKER